MVGLLDSGLYYMYGRDTSLRPLLVFSPKVILTLEIELDDAMLATHFVAQYIIDNLFKPGKIENWVHILDLANLSFTSMPKKWIISFIKNFNHHYYQRNRRMFLLNVGWGVRTMWNIVKIFVHNTTKQKLIFDGSNTSKLIFNQFQPFNIDKILKEMVHPQQLQKKSVFLA